MKYTQIPTDVFEKIQLNAGVICTSFDTSSGAVTGIVGATTGGVNFTDVPTFTDFGDDIDNCPKNTMELKRIESREVKMSGTYVSVDANSVASLMGAADISSNTVTPRDDLKTSDFKTLWWVGDYGDEDGGFMAIKLNNALSTGGFAIQSADKNKGQFSFEYTAHYSIAAPDTVPYELWIKAE
jgi:hypothetical protein